jgi:hypothetical protein
MSSSMVGGGGVKRSAPVVASNPVATIQSVAPPAGSPLPRRRRGPRHPEPEAGEADPGNETQRQHDREDHEPRAQHR